MSSLQLSDLSQSPKGLTMSSLTPEIPEGYRSLYFISALAGRRSRNRTHTKGFGDPCTTIILCACVVADDTFSVSFHGSLKLLCLLLLSLARKFFACSSDSPLLVGGILKPKGQKSMSEHRSEGICRPDEIQHHKGPYLAHNGIMK